MKESLKRAIRVNFDAALEAYLPEDAVAHETALQVIGHSALGENDITFDGSTVSEIAKKFALEPFVQMARKFSKEAARQDGIPAGVAVHSNGRIFGTLMRRLVTVYASGTSRYELLLVQMDGELFGFVGENEVERLTDFSAANLARLVDEEEVEFQEALQFLLLQREEEMTVELFMTCQLAISWANMGKPETLLELPGDRKVTAGEIISEFGLEPFVQGSKHE